MVHKSTTKKSLAQYLIDSLHRLGCREIFGIPGDFVLDFFEVIEKSKKLKILSLSHEPSLAFAADGFSRIKNRLTAVGVTFGAGGFNSINSVACAYAERSPLVIISGAPGVNERDQGILLHHQTKSLSSQLKVFQEVTAYATCLDDPEQACEEIQKALNICLSSRRPVYIEIPRDQIHQKIPIKKWSSEKNFHDQAGTSEAVREIKNKLSKSKRPVLMVGLEVHRYHLQKEVIKLSEHLQIPVITSFMARCTYPVDHPLYAGVYMGGAGQAKAKAIVEKSDCIIMLGLMITDTNMGVSLKNLNPKNIINACDHQLIVSHHHYQNIELKKLILEMKEKLSSQKKKAHIQKSPVRKLYPPKHYKNKQLQVMDIIDAINTSFAQNGPMPLVADTGDSVFASTDVHSKLTVASGYYASMGFSVPAGMGMQLALKQRVLILCGDGAFHMTGPEIANCKKFKINPIVVILNNRNWEMLQVIKPDAQYFDVPDWDFSQIAQAMGGTGFRAETQIEFWQALQNARKEKTFCIIDARVPAGNRSATLENYLSKVRK